MYIDSKPLLLLTSISYINREEVQTVIVSYPVARIYADHIVGVYKILACFNLQITFKNNIKRFHVKFTAFVLFIYYSNMFYAKNCRLILQLFSINYT